MHAIAIDRFCILRRAPAQHGFSSNIMPHAMCIVWTLLFSYSFASAAAWNSPAYKWFSSNLRPMQCASCALPLFSYVLGSATAWSFKCTPHGCSSNLRTRFPTHDYRIFLLMVIVRHGYYSLIHKCMEVCLCRKVCSFNASPHSKWMGWRMDLACLMQCRSGDNNVIGRRRGRETYKTKFLSWPTNQGFHRKTIYITLSAQVEYHLPPILAFATTPC